MSKKVLIVGGVAGGASAAARLRRLDETAEIIMFERDEYISFANCGLPYYIGETIKERERLLVQTPEAMHNRFNIDVRNNSEVISIDTNNKKVKVRNKEKDIYEENYDYLILSPGGKPMKANIPGIGNNKIFTLRNIPDTDKIKKYVDNKDIKNAIVIGGGYIGIEMAENLKERGINVTLIEAAPHIMASLDSEMAVIAEKELQDNGIGLILGDGVKEFKDEGKILQVTLSSGVQLDAELVILAIGVLPDTEFLKESGIVLGDRGHIIVNEKMETNKQGVYAVGDAIEVVDFITKQKTAIPLAGPANKQGRIVADNIAGLNSTYKGTQGTSIIKIFNMTAATTGANERTLKKANIPYKVIYVHPASHATYYPESFPMTLKLLFNDEGLVLGSQIVGYDGVDKRIDVIATVIRLKGTIYDLTELELAYAPPFSSAKDPVNMAGFVAQNLLEGKSNVATIKEIENLEDDTIILDVRTETEFNNGHIEGAINIPVDDLRNRLNELDKSKKIIEYCQVGLRGHVAGRILEQNGFKVKNLTGGYKTFSMSKFKPNVVNKNADKGNSNHEKDNENRNDKNDKNNKTYDKSLDACGLCCPGPLMQIKSCMEDLSLGQILKVTASDPGFYEDVIAWCKRTNNELLDIKRDGATTVVFIKKGLEENITDIVNQDMNIKDNKTMVVFSGDLDKAIASFIIANGAVSMGKKVTMFFTFWGLNILRKHEKVSTQKGFIDKLFGMMMPRGSKKLKLSNMNMMGIGAKMIRTVMKNKNVTSLEDLINAAVDSGVEIVACQMSMDVMGIKKEELIDGVKIGGVGYYLGEAEDSNVNLFI